MKLLIITFTFMFISFGVKAHSLNGKYECRLSSSSLFRTTVIVKNFTKKTTYQNIITKENKPCEGNGVCDYKADISIGNKETRNTVIHYIDNNLKKRSYIYLVHHTTYDNSKNEGLRIRVSEKKFSEKTGSKWEKIHFAFCEPQ